MIPSATQFRIPPRMSSKAVLALLRDFSQVSVEHASAVRRTYLDTADWRVYAGGWTLEADQDRDTVDPERVPVALVLRDRRARAVVASATVASVPRFAPDLRDVGLWSEVRAALEDRRLLSHLESDSRVQRVNILDGEAKTTARVLLERHLLDGRGMSRHHLVRAVTVTPVRGYDRTAERLVEMLAASGLAFFDEPLFTYGLALLRRPAPGAKSGPGVPLEASMPAARAVGAIMGRLREHVIANEDGMREELDTEFLHDFRVAVRRARSILKSARSVYPEDASRDLAGELRWLASVTSSPRDLDVHLAEFESASSELSPLARHLSELRRTAQRDLVAAIDSPRYRRLLKAWQSLAATEPDTSAAPDAKTSAAELADSLVRRAHRRVMKRGRAIDGDAPPEALHDLRKRAKELRYLLECFQSLYREKPRGDFIKELKALQDNLGEFQDSQVLAGALRSMAEDLLDQRKAPASTLMAIGSLADGLDQRQSEARQEFHARFERFSSKRNRRRFRRLLDGGA
jgi:CHAD domain-containing protein